MKTAIWTTALLMLMACGTSTSQKKKSDEAEINKPNRPSALQNFKFFKRDGNEMLYGGPRDEQDFVINNLELEKDQFHYGLGREAFPALLEPEFITVDQANVIWADDDRFLVAYKGNEVKAYSIKDLTRHEIVNDMLDGEPIMAAYCILADLGAIYERDYGDEVLTFALSGYTYYDPEVWDGLDGFVFWDRETESLWWPLIGKAVSGPLKGTKLIVMDEAHWEDTNWKTVKEKYSDAQVLRSGQDFERPKGWEDLSQEEIANINNNFKAKK